MASETSALEECPLCKDHYTIAALAPCDHRVCYKCSVRLRIVCGSNDCSQCRKSSDQVIITRFPGTFMTLVRSIGFQKKGFLYTENDLLRDVEELLANKCTFCKTGLVYGTFEDLRKHVNKEHKLLFCDFCYENLKLFPTERKAYTSSQLVEHRRNGDADDKSYRPHPPCQFCDNQRFFDDDALYRHLKSEHFSCHLCVATNLFFSDYSELRKHFSVKHYLCEEGNCREQRFTNAFSNELDFRHHRAAFHANTMSKDELKDLKQLDLAAFSRLEVSSPNSSRRQIGSGEAGRRAGERGERVSRYEKRLREIQREREALHSDGNESDSQVRGPQPASLVPAEFPTLSGQSLEAGKQSVATSASKAVDVEAKSAAAHIALASRSLNVGKTGKTEEDFPALCPSGSSVARSGLTTSGWAGAVKPVSGSNGAKKSSTNKTRISSSNTAPRNHYPVADPIVAVQPPPPPKKKEKPPKQSKQLKEEPKEPKPELISNMECAAPADKPINKILVKPEMDFPPLPTNAMGRKMTSSAVEDEEALYYASSMSQDFPALSPTPLNKAAPPPGFAAAAKALPMAKESPMAEAHITSSKSPSQPAVLRAEKPNIKSEEDFPDLPLAAPKPASGSKKKAPPPGFSIIMPKGQTSSSDSFPAPPKSVQQSVPFWRPSDYEKRNSSLQSAIAKNLNANQAEEFRTISRRFRDGILPAFDFLSRCVDLFPRKQLGFILSELIVLLPDVQKQKLLFDAVSADSLLSTLIPHLLSTCSKCSQITTNKDAALHRNESHNLKAPLSANGLPTGDEDPSRIKVDLSNYVINGTH